MRSRSPRTSVKMGHKHSYVVDANGNGRTSRNCHPLNPTICHAHEIRNYVVQHQASECYPDCVGVAAPGVGLHGHEISIPEGARTGEIIGQPIMPPTKNIPATRRTVSGFVNRVSANRAMRTNQLVGLPQNESAPGVNNFGIGDDLGFDDFNPDSGGSTNPGGNMGGGTGGSMTGGGTSGGTGGGTGGGGTGGGGGY